MMWEYGYGWGGMLLMLLVVLLFLALLAVIIWAIVRLATGITAMPPSTRVPPAAPSALETLGQRYARGEIDTPTYEQMRARLEGPRTQPPTGGPP